MKANSQRAASRTVEMDARAARTESGEVEISASGAMRVGARRLSPPPKPARTASQIRALPCIPVAEQATSDPFAPRSEVITNVANENAEPAARPAGKYAPISKYTDPIVANFVADLPQEVLRLGAREIGILAIALAAAATIPVAIVALLSPHRPVPAQSSQATVSEHRSALPQAPAKVVPNAEETNAHEATDATAAFPLHDGSDSAAPNCDALLSTSSEPYDHSYAHKTALDVAHRELVRGNFDASQRAFCKAARLPDSTPNMLLELAQLLLLRRDAQQSAKWAQRAADLDPNNKRARSMLGDALIRTGKPAEARTHWLVAAGISESDEAAISQMVDRDLLEAQRALSKRDYHRAERFFRRVVAFRPDIDSARRGIAEALENIGLASAARKWEPAHQ